MAGLKLKDLLQEPTAAILAYIKKHKLERSKILVFDFGGGTLDISIAQIKEDGYELKAIAGDSHLDEAVAYGAAIVANAIEKEDKMPLISHLMNKVQQKLNRSLRIEPNGSSTNSSGNKIPFYRASPPEWRSLASIAYHKDKLYYLGGEDSKSNEDTNCVDLLAVGMDRYFDYQTTNENGLKSKTFKSCLCFDPSAPVGERIYRIANMNYARKDHSLVAANGKLYAIGGPEYEFFHLFTFTNENPSALLARG
ncbi:hypothetical protein WR25_12582 [Diploscapter pachys]|uniref:Uncharacterized protein n=1 Tax=Diploscapter pachys TaxID=2018661 RepID=A0A2A2M1D9_9BILA|nr:hypothetical protein WR25_12582 [Diploscapter pachys]